MIRDSSYYYVITRTMVSQGNPGNTACFFLRPMTLSLLFASDSERPRPL